MNSNEVQRVLEKYAAQVVSPDEAQYFAVEAVETHIKKYPRTNPISSLLSDVENWTNNKGKSPRVTVDLPGLSKIDFNGLSPSPKIKWIHDILEKKTKANGISLVSVVNSDGMHTMHFWTQGLAKRGLLAVAAYNGGPLAVVPFNGTRGIFGTNPLTYAFPNKEDITVVDFATSEIPFFQIMDSVKSGKKLPKNSAVDSEGIHTRDATKAIDAKEVSNLLPIGGGYKGYALNYLLEVMTGSMVGSMLSTEMSDTYIGTEHGGFILAIDINAMNPIESFKSEVSQMNTKVREQRGRDGTKVIIPGDNNLERYKKGVGRFRTKEETLKKLEDLAASLK